MKRSLASVANGLLGPLLGASEALCAASGYRTARGRRRQRSWPPLRAVASRLSLPGRAAPGLGQLPLGIERREQPRRQSRRDLAIRRRGDGRRLVGGQAPEPAAPAAPPARRACRRRRAQRHRVEQLGKGTERLRSSGGSSVFWRSQTPTASTMHEVRLAAGVGRHRLQISVGDDARRRAPSSARSSPRLLTERMKSSTSSGLMSVPVAIMSTVTAMRGL